MKRQKIKSFASNIIIIFAAQIIVKLLGMLYRMVITNIDGFGDAGNGFYSAGFQIYKLLLAVSSVGIPNAVSKLISEREALSDAEGTNRIFKTSLFIFAVIGALLSFALFVFAKPIAKYVLNMDGAEYTMAALAPSVFFVCISSVFRGYFSGTDKLNIMSISQIIEQVFKSVLTIVFVLFAVGKPPEIMSGWANFATAAATIFGTIYLILMYKADNLKHNFIGKRIVRSEFLCTAKTVLMIAVPISLCSVISAVNRIVDTATITRGIEAAFAAFIPAREGFDAVLNPSIAQLNDEAVRLAGMLSKSDTLLNLPLALNISFATVLVPSISRCRAVDDRSKIKEYINFSVLTSVVLVLPCAAGYVILAEPIYNLIYPNAALGYELLQLSAVSLVFTALNQTVTGALQGLGKVHVPAFALAVGCIVKTVLNCILISVPQINIYGAVIGSIMCQLTVFVIELSGIYKYIDKRHAIKNILIKPLFCSVLMCAVTYPTYKIGNSVIHSNAAALVLAIVISALAYGVFVVLFKVFGTDELAKTPIFGKVYAFFDKKHSENI